MQQNKIPKIGLLAGSFNPVTIGHVHLITEGAQLFDKLIVAVSSNSTKRNETYSVGTRKRLIEESIADCPEARDLDIEVIISHNELTANVAKEHNARYLLRGLRNTIDLEYEKTIARVNKGIYPELTNVFSLSSPDDESVSSSVVRGLIGYPGWEEAVKPFVSRPVFNHLIKTHEGYKDRFVDLIMRMSIRPDTAFAELAYKKVFDKYTNKNRHYHTLDHIARMLDALDEFTSTREFLYDKDILELAIWFHDVIYNPEMPDNELSSALFMEDLLSSYIRKEILNKAKKYIMATTHDRSLEDETLEEMLISDLDLLELGTSEYRYFQYGKAVRKEYYMYSDVKWNEGRHKFLDTFLASPIFYITEYERTYGEQARKNLLKEKESLNV